MSAEQVWAGVQRGLNTTTRQLHLLPPKGLHHHPHTNSTTSATATITTGDNTPGAPSSLTIADPISVSQSRDEDSDYYHHSHVHHWCEYSDVPSAIIFPSTATYVDPIPTSPHCDRTCTSHIGLASHPLIHLTWTGEPVTVAPKYTRLHNSYCQHTFDHRMGLFGHKRSHESGTRRYSSTSSTLYTPSNPPIYRTASSSSTSATTTSITTIATKSAALNLSYA
nr:unnamed protein product [Spirometra erinaceieuropaei]